MGLHNPLPASLGSESRKAGKILASFIDPKQAIGMTDVIPPSILSHAKGLAVITVLKAGFLFSGRVGSGIVIARLEDGTWSAPSAIATAGMGVGGQIGAELTDFVMILNSRAAVRTFASLGSVTLGGNVSVAAGPIGRNAEASGSASHKGVAAVFSYSKTRGLFAGVSLEGSVLVERRDANQKFYRSSVTAKQLLSGRVPPPQAAAALYRVLDSRVFSAGVSYSGDDMYNDIPVYGEEDDEIWNGRRGAGYGEDAPRRQNTGSSANSSSLTPYRSKPTPAQKYGRSRLDEDNDFLDDDDLDDIDVGPSRRGGSNQPVFRSQYRDSSVSNSRSRASSAAGSQRQSPAPGRPTAPKPDYSTATRAVALYTFNSEEPGDLGFRKGDTITIVEKSDSVDDWWTGRLNGSEGIFPANYVRLL